MRRLIALLAALVTAALLEACIVHGHHGHLHGHSAVEVVLPVAHVCSVHCGHYVYGGRWYYWSGHVHGPGCGHVQVRGVWTLH